MDLQGTNVFGASLNVETDDRIFTACHVSGDSPATQHPATLHLGLGPREKVRRLTVTWPGGRTSVIEARLAKLEGREEIGAFFHAAALADFKIFRARDRQRKISSRAGAVTLELVPLGKVISGLRELFPKAKIAGWKYELDGTPRMWRRRRRGRLRKTTRMCA